MKRVQQYTDNFLQRIDLTNEKGPKTGLNSHHSGTIERLKSTGYTVHSNKKNYNRVTHICITYRRAEVFFPQNNLDIQTGMDVLLKIKACCTIFFHKERMEKSKLHCIYLYITNNSTLKPSNHSVNGNDDSP